MNTSPFQFKNHLIWSYVALLITLSVVAFLYFPFSFKKYEHLDVLYHLRLPAILTAVACGSALAISGFVMQSLFKNKLADPYMMGISSGSSLMISLSLVTFSSFELHQFFISIGTTISALIGAFLVIVLLLILAKKFGYGLYLLLLGIIFTYLSGSVQMLIQYIANPSELKQLSLWNLGTFNNTTPFESIFFIVIVLLIIVFFIFKSKQLSLYLLGETTAKSAGLNTNKMFAFYLIGCSILIGSCVSFCGPIAFIGLAVPNLIKIFHGQSNPKFNLIINALLGAILSLICYILGNAFTDFVLPVNIISAAIGSPIILYVLIRKRWN